MTPKEADFVPGKRNLCIWREYKTYKNYLYAISDDGVPNSFQIIDMSYLPDSVHVVYDADTLVQRAHTVYIDGDKLYLASVKFTTSKYSMAVYSLANPEKPTLLRYLNQDYPAISDVHDMLVRNDTVYASCGYSGLFIYHYNSQLNKFIYINSIQQYPEPGYNHSSALTPDGHTFVFCDEVPRNLPVKIYDISDINNITIDTIFKSAEGPTPHNPYIKDKNHVIIAYYQDGLQIFDISNPKMPVRSGYFDTDTIDGISNNYNEKGTAYHGCWGAYIHSPSGNILASDMQNGLYVLNADLALSITTINNTSFPVSVFPNPSENLINLQFELSKSQVLSFEILDMAGRRLFLNTENNPAGTITRTIHLDKLEKGMYLIKISGKEVFFSSKFIKN